MTDLTYLAPGSENVFQTEFGVVMKRIVQVMYLNLHIIFSLGYHNNRKNK